MKVIGAGLGRTGTDSVKAALELLGFGPCHHMKEMFANPSSIRGWLRAAQEGRPDFVQLLGGFESTVDWPSVFFWRQLVEAYPTAKVLLTVRDPQSWYNSVAETLYCSRYETIDAAPSAIREQFLATPALRDQPRLVERTIWQGTFHGRFADRAYAIDVYRAHVAAVRDRVPAGRLLEFDVADGWGPLCAFLGVGVPDESFPRLNTSAAYRQRLEEPRTPADGRG